jgi:acyl carrier protein
MGLDAVEIVMKVEDAFEISIENAEAEKIVTPRQLIELVMGKVGRTDRAQCLTQRAFHRLRASLIRHTGLGRSAVKPETRMAVLLPLQTRTVALREVLDDIGVAASPELVRPGWLVLLIIFGSLISGLAAACLLGQALHSSNFVVIQLLSFPMISAPITAVFIGWLAMRLTSNQCHNFKPAMATAGGFSRWIVAQGPEIVGTPPGQWRREQVAERVREIVIDSLGCEKEYREDAHFLKDLGLS